MLDIVLGLAAITTSLSEAAIGPPGNGGCCTIPVPTELAGDVGTLSSSAHDSGNEIAVTL